MTEKTARAEDAAAAAEAASPAGQTAARPDADAGSTCRRAEGPALAYAGGDGKSAQAHRARSHRCASLRRRRVRPGYPRRGRQYAPRARRGVAGTARQRRGRREGAHRWRRADGAGAHQSAGEERRAPVQPARREVRSQRASGHVRGAERFRTGRQRRRGRATRLYDRRARVAPGNGWRVEGRSQIGAAVAARSTTTPRARRRIPKTSRRERAGASISVRRCREPCAGARIRWSSYRRALCRPSADNRRRRNAAIGSP